MTSAGNDTHWSEFAKIIPHNQEAKDALDTVYDYKSLSQLHRSFLRVERIPRPQDSDSGTDKNSSASHRTSLKSEYWAGHDALSLQDTVQAKTSVGWRLGKGASGALTETVYGEDQGVDLLVIRPGDKGSRRTAPVHARICFHARSGVPMIFGVENERPVLYKTHNAYAPLTLGQGESHVLYQPSNLFSVGKLEYNLVLLEFGNVEYPSFVVERDAVLYGPGATVPHHAKSAMPRKT
ncbi:MAG: hypothetical protein LQ346_001801 [Caloplaca aetnensis]|nr:MAG: hypothetical protein LQ346_001801 [Caloplaca aetnensis]